MKWKVWIIIAFGIIAIGFSRWTVQRDTSDDAPSSSGISPASPLPVISAPLPPGTSKPIPMPTPTPTAVPARDVLLDVPFTVQAPLRNWDDIVYQNACEEAAILMAMRWVEGKPLSREEAVKEIKALSDYSRDNFGFYLDQSAAGVARLMKTYYKHEAVNVSPDIAVSDIKAELTAGNLVIVPVNGRKLKNPFFTPPGPIRHMLVLKGYDSKTREFITNDPGTSRGKDYRYPEGVLETALRDYPTGYHEPILGVRKVMIVVSPRLSTVSLSRY